MFALLDICKRTGDRGHRPAAEVARQVGRGKYVLREPSLPRQRR